jgi:hypothetical protein
MFISKTRGDVDNKLYLIQATYAIYLSADAKLLQLFKFITLSAEEANEF